MFEDDEYSMEEGVLIFEIGDMPLAKDLRLKINIFFGRGYFNFFFTFDSSYKVKYCLKEINFTGTVTCFNEIYA